MKLAFAVLTSALALCAMEPQAAKAAPARKAASSPAAKEGAAPAAAPAKVIKPLEIPKGAVETEPGTFAYTDPQGKKWLYRKTPFGIARLEDKPASATAAADPAADPFANVKITQQGDLVMFERPGPFGVYKWQKKTTEMDEKERAAFQKAQSSSAKQN